MVGSQTLELGALFLLFLSLFGVLSLERVEFEGVVGERCLKVWMVKFAHEGLEFFVVNVLRFVLVFGVDFFEFAFGLVE